MHLSINFQTKAKKVKKVPKGWSDYQAAWIVESDAEDNSEYESGSDGEDHEEFMSCEEDASDNEANAVSDTYFKVIFTHNVLPTFHTRARYLSHKIYL